MNGIILTLLSGSACAAVIEGIREYLSWRRGKKDKAEETTEDRIKNVETKVAALVESQKYIMYDRIRYLGQEYIKDGEIDFDDRRILNNMHSSYHSGLSGNGDLDTLMGEVNKLPLKQKG